jgi:hypothetical protein
MTLLARYNTQTGLFTAASPLGGHDILAVSLQRHLDEQAYTFIFLMMLAFLGPLSSCAALMSDQDPAMAKVVSDLIHWWHHQWCQ